MKIYYKTIIPAVILVTSSLLLTTAHAKDTGYSFCRSLLTESAMSWDNDAWVISSVFRNNLDVLSSDVGMENSFNSYIEAELGGHARMAICFHSKSYQESADERNELISDYRADDENYKTVSWFYRGN